MLEMSIQASRDRAGSEPRVLVTTVTYNSSGVLDAFLASLSHAVTEQTEVIVVDNASGDAELSHAIAERHGARFLPSAGNLGYGSAVNLALRGSAPPEFLVVANPDVVVAANAIDTLLEVMRKDAHIGSAGPRILNEDGTVYPSARKLPSLVSGAGHAVFSGRWRNNPWSRRYRDEERYDLVQRDAGWLSGSFLVVRGAAFQQVGGFDEGFFMYFEDVDLGARLAAAGWRNTYVPSAIITHSGAHSTQTSSNAMVAAHHASAYRYLANRYPAPVFAPLRLVLRIGLALRRGWLTRSG